jgi:hypothetical protein
LQKQWRQKLPLQQKSYYKTQISIGQRGIHCAKLSYAPAIKQLTNKELQVEKQLVLALT